MWDKVGRMPARVIYTILLISVAVPLLKPLGLPIRIMPTTEQCFRVIESLPEGAKVAVSYDYSLGSVSEIQPLADVFMQHLLRKNTKVFGMSSVPEGYILAENNLKMWKDAGKTYGKDYVNLGFFAGSEAGLAAWCENFRAVFKTDAKGTPIEQIDMARDIKGIKDFDLVISVNFGPGGYGTPDVWIRQAVVTHKMKLLMSVGAVMVPSTMPYLQSGQLVGMLAGLRAGAEYERMLGKPGDATRAMDAQSTSHLAILILILVGNISYFSTKHSREKEGAK